MRKKNWIKSGAVSVSVVMLMTAIILGSCSTLKKTDATPVVKTMIQFDQAFIPSLALTSKGDREGSVKAMSILEKEWTVLKPQLLAFYPDDTMVADKLSLVDKSIMEAENGLASDLPMLTVHETLEAVKKPFLDIRKAKGIDYYPDLLDAYHTTMEEIITLTDNKKSTDLSDQDMKKLENLAAIGVEQWESIQDADFDSGLFGFSETKTENLKKSIEIGKQESLTFLALVQDGNTGAVITEAAGLKPYYTKVYLQFGNFARLQQ